MNQLRDPFIGSEALACGAVSRHQLRTRYRAVFPGVYAQKLSPLSCTNASSRRGCGRAGERPSPAWRPPHYGAKWIDDDVVVDLIYANPKPPPGIRLAAQSCWTASDRSCAVVP